MTSLNLIQVNPFASPQWDKIVDENPSSQFFHYSCWAKTLTNTYRFPYLYFTIPSDMCTIPLLVTKTLKGKKKAIALPFSDGCDIRCSSVTSDQLVEKLLDISRSEKIDRLEFHGTTEFQPSGGPSHSYWGHRLDISCDEKTLLKNVSPPKRRNIQKAQRLNTVVTFYNTMESVKEFYRLHCITRKRHGLPPQPVRFIDEIYLNIVASNKGQVALAQSGSSVVAGALFLFAKSEVLYKFGASDKSLQNLRSNDLVMWEAIKKYSKEGYKTLSFGKTEKFHEGLCRYKEGFGAKRVELTDHIYQVVSGKKICEAPDVNGIHNVVFRQLPIPVLRLCGELLYKYSA